MNACTLPTALAKISRPRHHGPVPRPRLFERLDAHAHMPVVWVAGPPGAGKTTLVSSWLGARGRSHIWYQLDAGDGDVATFIHYFGLAVRLAVGERPLHWPALTPEYMPALLSFTRRCMQAMVEALDGPAVIVLDNYEQLPAQTPLYSMLLETVRVLPRGWQIMVLSRRNPPEVCARMQVNRELALLGAEDLSLTREEALALAQSRRGGDGDGAGDGAQPPDPGRVEALLRCSAGWVAGFSVLLSDAARAVPAPLPQALPQPRGQPLLSAYFAAEIFHGLEHGLQEALAATALLPIMTAQQAQQLCGHADIAAVLARLHKCNCFVVQRATVPPSYEYHALFREFLLERAARLFDAGRWRELQCRAAALLAQAGQAQAAAALYQAAGDADGLAALALREAAALLQAGRHRTLRDWLDALPPPLFESLPWLYAWRGAAQLPFDPVAARDSYERAYACFEQADDAAGLYTAWAGVMESFFYEWLDFRPADRWITEYERLRARHAAFPSRAIECRTYRAMSVLMYRQPQHPLLPEWSRRIVELGDAEGGDFRAVMGAYLANWYLSQGQTHEARAIAERIRAGGDAGLSPLGRALRAVALGMVHSVRGELPPCREVVEAGLAEAARADFHTFDFLLSAQMVRCCVIAGELAQAQQWLETMNRALRSHSRINGAFSRHLVCNLALQQGELLQALDHARQSLALSLESGVPFLEAHARIDLARVLLAQDAAGAGWRAEVAAARELGRAIGSPVIEHACLELEVLAALRRGQPEAARPFLARALELSQAMDGATWLLEGPRVTALLYDAALHAGLAVPHVQRLIRRRGLPPPDPATAADDWPWPVRLRTLGGFELLCEGEPLRFAGKAQHKPLELLQCLVALGGQGVHQDEVADALWPDAVGDAADQALRTTLHRLRKLLPSEQAVRLENRQLTLDPAQVWADSLAFERVARQGTAADAAALRQALGRYRGAFLPGESAAWAVACRERLRARFIRMAQQLGSLLESRGDAAGAVEVYLLAVEAEPLAEGLYRQLIAVHARLGQRAEAVAAYQRCSELLRSQLGLGPAAETQALHRRVVEQ